MSIPIYIIGTLGGPGLVCPGVQIHFIICTLVSDDYAPETPTEK